MARVVDHSKDCKRYLGKKYIEIHKFLDQFSSVFPPDIFVDYHRTFFHNSYGLEIIRYKWGKEAEVASFIHLCRDYYEGTIDHLSLDKILKRIPRVMMYFNRLDHGYWPQPHTIRNWEGKSLCYVKFGDNRYVDLTKRNVKNSL